MTRSDPFVTPGVSDYITPGRTQLGATISVAIYTIISIRILELSMEAFDAPTQLGVAL